MRNQRDGAALSNLPACHLFGLARFTALCCMPSLQSRSHRRPVECAGSERGGPLPGRRPATPPPTTVSPISLPLLSISPLLSSLLCSPLPSSERGGDPLFPSRCSPTGTNCTTEQRNRAQAQTPTTSRKRRGQRERRPLEATLNERQRKGQWNAVKDQRQVVRHSQPWVSPALQQ